MRNHKTNLYPGSQYGYFSVRTLNKVEQEEKILIAGYGADYEDIYAHFAQQSHYGKIRKIGGLFNSKSRVAYDIDTMEGNSGSPIILESTQEIIGVHSHGYCEIWGPYNEGTLISKNEKFKTAITECLQ